MKKIVCFITVMLVLLLSAGMVQAADNIYSASVEGEISLHISPDEESYVITKIPACSKLSLLETQRTWGLVEFNNKAGWINLSFTRSNYSKAAEATGNDMVKSVQVKGKDGRAILYNIPSENLLLGSSEKYSVPNNTVLKITRQTQSGWGLVSMHGKYAWIKMKETTPYDVKNDADKYGIYYVYTLSAKGEGVSLWSNEHGTGLCSVIPDCIKLTIRESKNGYGYVSYNGVNGWINLNYTTQSLANAQSNAGESVNAEYVVVENEEGSVNVLNVPSENECDIPVTVGTVKSGDSVYVLRSTLSGWLLINCDGTLGWLPPQSATVAEVVEKENPVNVFSSPQKLFVSTVKGEGLSVYPTTEEKTASSYIPETVEFKIIAESGNFKYIYSDYAAGWTNEIYAVNTYDEAISQYKDKKIAFYVTNKETNLMSMPTDSKTSGSISLAIIPEGKYFDCIKTVKSGKSKWLLAEIDGNMGWIKKSHTDKTNVSLIVVVLAVALILIALLIVIVILRHIKKKKQIENIEKEVGKDGKSI